MRPGGTALIPFPRGGACVYEEFWSFNCGGLSGLWNLGHFVQTLDLRPVVVCVQEFTGGERQLTAIKHMMADHPSTFRGEL